MISECDLSILIVSRKKEIGPFLSIVLFRRFVSRYESLKKVAKAAYKY